MNLPAPAATLMTGDDYRESLRAYRPRVYLDGRLVDSVADEPGFAPGINALALTYDYAHKPEYANLMTAVQHTAWLPAPSAATVLYLGGSKAVAHCCEACSTPNNTDERNGGSKSLAQTA